MSEKLPAIQQRALEGAVMPPGGAPDHEVADMMERLNVLQHFLTVQCIQHRGDANFRNAMTLVQDVRVMIVERLYRSAIHAD